MRVPSDIAAAVAAGRSLGFKCRADGTVSGGFESGWGGGAYPPPGYLPWNILEVGNGDTYGYYWPIGREDHAPIVCTIMHDAWSLLPVASSIQACIRLHLICDLADTEELLDVAERFTIDVRDIPAPEVNPTPPSEDGPTGTTCQPSGIEFWGARSAATLLPNDPNSPHLQFAAAKEAIANRRPDEAEDHLRVALSQLPEYSDALALRAQLCRQQQDHRRAAQSLMEAITSLLCFGARDRKKLLQWLQRLPDAAGDASLDPLWSRRLELTFNEGVKENDDYRVFEELVEAYHRAGMGIRAVRLRILIGELMNFETVSFRERYNWTATKHQTLLRADLERAGLHKRLAAFP